MKRPHTCGTNRSVEHRLFWANFSPKGPSSVWGLLPTLDWWFRPARRGRSVLSLKQFSNLLPKSWLDANCNRPRFSPSTLASMPVSKAACMMLNSSSTRAWVLHTWYGRTLEAFCAGLQRRPAHAKPDFNWLPATEMEPESAHVVSAGSNVAIAMQHHPGNIHQSFVTPRCSATPCYVFIQSPNVIDTISKRWRSKKAFNTSPSHIFP